MKRVLLIILAVLFAACAVAPVSDSDYSYSPISVIPTDENVYRVEVEFVAGLESDKTTRSGSSIYYSGQILWGSASLWQEGKGFARVKLLSMDPAIPGYEIGDLAIIKTTDRKVIATLPGDRSELICRREFEAIAAVHNNESFDEEEKGTWEIDYCRMVDGRIGP